MENLNWLNVGRNDGRRKVREIGHTEKGGVLVELTRGEFNTLVGLQAALDGDFRSDFRVMRMVDRRCDKAFEAIYAWVKCKFNLNEMQAYLDRMHKVLEPDQGLLEKVKDEKDT